MAKDETVEKLGQAWVSKVTASSDPEVSVIGADVSPMPVALARDEWLRRYAARFVEVAALPPDAAEQCAKAESFEVLSEGYEDDPEGAADMEMSYWEAD